MDNSMGQKYNQDEKVKKKTQLKIYYHLFLAHSVGVKSGKST